MKPNRTKKQSLFIGLVTAGLLVAAYFGLSLLFSNDASPLSYYIEVVKLILINILLAVSLNVVTGFLGQLALGHSGFMTVGAYTMILIVRDSGLPFIASVPLGLLAGGLVAAAFGLLIGIPALRLRGDYLAILTLAFGEIIRVLVTVCISTTAQSIPGKMVAKLQPFAFPLIYFVVVLSVILIYTFGTSRHGRAVLSIRDNEIAADACGINTVYFKLFAFVFGAFFAGIAGGLYGIHVGSIDPSRAGFMFSIDILVMVVLGGMGSITGSIVAATALTLLTDFLKDIPNFSAYRMIAYAVILIVMMLFRPSGLLGRSEFSLSGAIAWLRGRKGKSQAVAAADEEAK